MNTSRTYTMRSRAKAAELTRQRVLEAAAGLLRSRLRSDIRLEDVAADAGVSVQTVLRVYGSRDALLQQALEVVLAEIADQLGGAEPGDIDAAVRTWFDHYETFGDVVLRNLADESDPAVRPMVELGRTKHRGRVEDLFAPYLAGVADPRRRDLVDALVCVSDVYTWKLLRRDFGRSRRRAEQTMTLMITSILGDASP